MKNLITKLIKIPIFLQDKCLACQAFIVYKRQSSSSLMVSL